MLPLPYTQERRQRRHGLAWHFAMHAFVPPKPITTYVPAAYRSIANFKVCSGKDKKNLLQSAYATGGSLQINLVLTLDGRMRFTSLA